MSLVRRLRVAAMFGVASLSSVAQAQAPSFQPLGDLTGGAFNSAAWCISADGAIVAGGGTSAAGNQAFRWDATAGMVGLADLPGNPFHCHVRGISNDGAVLVGYGNYASATSVEGVRWLGGSPVGLGFPPGMTNSYALDVSGDGSKVIIQSEAGATTNAYVWTQTEGFVQIPFLTNGQSTGTLVIPDEISDDGSTVVGFGNLNGVSQAIRWTAKGGTEGLGDFDGGFSNSNAEGVSADGSVVVGFGHTAAGKQAFRWTEKTGLVSLGTFPGAVNGGEGLSTDADGTVIVGTAATAVGNPLALAAFIWDEHHGMRDLRALLVNLGVPVPANWKLNMALAVSANGRTIAGWGTNPQGQFEAFRATLDIVGDATADGHVNVSDLLWVIQHWGACPAPPTFCAGDTAPLPFGDGQVNVEDLLAVITAWTG